MFIFAGYRSRFLNQQIEGEVIRIIIIAKRFLQVINN